MDIYKVQTGRNGGVSGAFLKKATAQVKAKSGADDVRSAFQDKLTIQSEKSTPLSDEQFLSVNSKKIAAEVLGGADEFKVIDLQKQVALGSYDIGVSEIVRRMMLEGEA